MNPYGAPSELAQAAEAPRPPSTRRVEPVFHPISPLKLALFSFCSFGCYEMYWFYKQWSYVDGRAGRSGIAKSVFRAIFSVFFAHALFTRVKTVAVDAEVTPPRAGLATAAWIVFVLISRLPAPYWLVAMASFVPLLHVQGSIQRINERLAPGHDANERWSAVTIFLCAIGLLFVMSGVVETFLPEEPGESSVDAVETPSDP